MKESSRDPALVVFSHLENLVTELERESPRWSKVRESMAAVGLEFSPDAVKCLERVLMALDHPERLKLQQLDFVDKKKGS